MTNQEAIKSIQNLNMVLSITESERESVNIAIAALEYQEKIKMILPKMYEEIAKRMFSAEIYNEDFEGCEINNLLCYGDVAEILDEYLGSNNIPSPWHNAADGDLPPEPKGNAEYYYTVDKYGRYHIYLYDDGFFKGSGRGDKRDTRIYLEDDNIVAWIELPEYKETKDEA